MRSMRSATFTTLASDGGRERDSMRARIAAGERVPRGGRAALVVRGVGL